MPERTCAVEECERPVRARGWCTLHYTRWRKTGDPGTVQLWCSGNPSVCTVEGCVRPYYGRGYCHTHYLRWKKHGNHGSVEIHRQVRGLCSFDDCGQLQAGKGLCTGHYQQYRRGKPLTPRRASWKSTTRDDLGRKRCRRCGEWLAIADFYPNARQSDGLYGYCKRCDRDLRLLRRYGITLARYDAMREAQGGGCAICGGAPKDSPSLHIDHDHTCCPGRRKSCGRCIRGLLCEDCNRVLGMFGDDPARFEAAISYLKNGGVDRDRDGGPLRTARRGEASLREPRD